MERDLYIQSNLPEGGGGISIYSQTCLKVEGDLYIQSNMPEGGGGISIYSQTCLKVEGGSLYTVKPALRWGDLYIQSNLPEVQLQFSH